MWDMFKEIAQTGGPLLNLAVLFFLWRMDKRLWRVESHVMNIEENDKHAH